MITAGFVLLGIIAGALGGVVGLGGGIVIIPALVYVFGFSQHMAQGTTLALMVPPIGILAAYAYYQKGYVDIKVAALICAGFLIGSYFGSHFAASLPALALQRIFGGLLLVVAIKMLVG